MSRSFKIILLTAVTKLPLGVYSFFLPLLLWHQTIFVSYLHLSVRKISFLHSIPFMIHQKKTLIITQVYMHQHK